MADELAPLLVIAVVGIEVAALALTEAKAKLSLCGFRKAGAGEKQKPGKKAERNAESRRQKAKSPVTRTGLFV